MAASTRPTTAMAGVPVRDRQGVGRGEGRLRRARSSRRPPTTASVRVAMQADRAADRDGRHQRQGVLDQAVRAVEDRRHARRRGALERHRQARGDVRCRRADGKTVFYAETSISIRGTRRSIARCRSRRSRAAARARRCSSSRACCSTFSLTSQLDDQYLAVGGKFELSNNSWAPYVGGKDGIVMPMPKGFRRAPDRRGRSAGRRARRRAGLPDRAGRSRRAASSSTRSSRCPSSAGNVDWDMDLPFGVYQSEHADPDAGARA